MSASQAVLTIILGNIIVLVPILLVSHMGARYGVPFAVAVRSSFGVRGACCRPLSAGRWLAAGSASRRGLVERSCSLWRLSFLGRPLQGTPIPGLGISAIQLTAFLLFWVVQIAVVTKGLGAVRALETWTAPLKLAVCAILAIWALRAGHGLHGVWIGPSAFAPGGPKAGRFWTVFWPSLTAMIASWAPLALNVPDFSRFARSQGDQILGQALGLPVPMGLLAVVSVLTTSATAIVYGHAIWDPVALAGRFSGPVAVLGLAVILLDTVSVNIAANLVAPAYDFSSVWPRRVSYRLGAYIAAAIGVVIMPWRLLDTSHVYIYVWLTGYAVLLGPICGIMIADYWLMRRTRLVVGDLYEPEGRYRYTGGFNVVALAAFLGGVAPNLPGFLQSVRSNDIRGPADSLEFGLRLRLDRGPAYRASRLCRPKPLRLRPSALARRFGTRKLEQVASQKPVRCSSTRPCAVGSWARADGGGRWHGRGGIVALASPGSGTGAGHPAEGFAKVRLVAKAAGQGDRSERSSARHHHVLGARQDVCGQYKPAADGRCCA